jgi:hypothetical protein
MIKIKLGCYVGASLKPLVKRKKKSTTSLEIFDILWALIDPI